MKFIVDKSYWNLFPESKLGVLLLKNMQNGESSEEIKLALGEANKEAKKYLVKEDDLKAKENPKTDKKPKTIKKEIEKTQKTEETERIDVVDAVIDAWKLAMQAEYDVVYNAEDDIEDWLKILGGE